MTECFVGFDTSNYTTSVAACTREGQVIANIKIPLPVKEGERGLRQSDAVFAHVKNLPEAMSKLRSTLEGKKVLAVGVSAYPRNQADSYMPCFLSGVAAAESFGAALNVPVHRFSHQNGHIMAAAYSSGATETVTSSPFVAFHVSGGTTEVLYVTPDGTDFSVKLIGNTEDINAGQAIDRIGVMMGLRFPCGKELEALAAGNDKKIPKPRICVREGNCNLSGLQNLAEQLWKKTGDAPLVSAYTLAFVAETLREMTLAVDEKHLQIPIIYAGGVMSNRYLQEVLGKRKNTYFAEPQFSADNAAGIALLTRRRFLNQ